MEVVCKLCHQNKDEHEFPHQNGKLRRRICWSCRGKRERAQLKLDMLEALGKKCACCGLDNPFFLTLDHINNDGSLHREKYNEQQIYRLARRESFRKDKWQCLCMNCNFAKGHFGQCPHVLGLTTEQAYEELKTQARLVFRTRHDYVAEYTGNQHTEKIDVLAAVDSLSDEQRKLLLAHLCKTG